MPIRSKSVIPIFASPTAQSGRYISALTTNTAHATVSGGLALRAGTLHYPASRFLQPGQDAERIEVAPFTEIRPDGQGVSARGLQLRIDGRLQIAPSHSTRQLLVSQATQMARDGLTPPATPGLLAAWNTWNTWSGALANRAASLGAAVGLGAVVPVARGQLAKVAQGAAPYFANLAQMASSGQLGGVLGGLVSGLGAPYSQVLTVGCAAQLALLSASAWLYNGARFEPTRITLGPRSAVDVTVSAGLAKVGPSKTLEDTQGALTKLLERFDGSIADLVQALCGANMMGVTNLFDLQRSNLKLSCDIEGLVSQMTAGGAGPAGAAAGVPIKARPAALSLHLGSTSQNAYGVSLAHTFSLESPDGRSRRITVEGGLRLDNSEINLKPSDAPVTASEPRAPGRTGGYLTDLLHYLCSHAEAVGTLQLDQGGWTPIKDVVPDLQLSKLVEHVELRKAGQAVRLAAHDPSELPQEEVSTVLRWLHRAMRAVNQALQSLLQQLRRLFGRTAATAPASTPAGRAFILSAPIQIRLTHLGFAWLDVPVLRTLDRLVCKLMSGYISRVVLAADGKTFTVHFRFFVGAFKWVPIPFATQRTLPMPRLADLPGIANLEESAAAVIHNVMGDPAADALRLVDLQRSTLNVTVPHAATVPINQTQSLYANDTSLTMQANRLTVQHTGRIHEGDAGTDLSAHVSVQVGEAVKASVKMTEDPVQALEHSAPRRSRRLSAIGRRLLPRKIV
jgi:hypothetical protein